MSLEKLIHMALEAWEKENLRRQEEEQKHREQRRRTLSKLLSEMAGEEIEVTECPLPITPTMALDVAWNPYSRKYELAIIPRCKECGKFIPPRSADHIRSLEELGHRIRHIYAMNEQDVVQAISNPPSSGIDHVICNDCEWKKKGKDKSVLEILEEWIRNIVSDQIAAEREG